MSNLLKNKVPLIPGYQFADPDQENFHKTQQFEHKQGAMCEKLNYLRESLDQNLIDEMKNSAQTGFTQETKQKLQDQIAYDKEQDEKNQPVWLKYDRKVLKFIAYFQEAVVEMPSENYRIRKCIIYYYLSDGTMYVTEPKIENSGIPQGVFIKRHRIPKQIGNPVDCLSWEDLNLAQNLTLYDRTFRVIDADEFTKQFYEEAGLPLRGPEDFPQDLFEIQKQMKEAKIAPPDTKEYKEYTEVKLGGGHPNNGLQKYIANDRKVLTFQVYWDDTTLEGGRNFYELNFFLSDDTVEVKEKRKQNSGKDNFPLLLRRAKLPKIPILTHYPGMSLKKEEYYGPLDLICGQTVVIYSRNCVIYDCNDQTIQWYNDQGIQQDTHKFPQQTNQKKMQAIPPYNGLGTEQDSLGSVYHLQPKPPKKDVHKIFTQDQYILRYEARLISKNREDNNKKFIISFFCGDDTIQVFQQSERNSGYWTGKLLERKSHKNPATNQSFTQTDFLLGSIISLNVYHFQLMRADEFTINYMKDRPQIFPECNIDHVLLKLKKESQKFSNYDEFLVAFVAKVDQKNKCELEFEEVVEGVKRFGFDCKYQEVYTLSKQFISDSKSGKVNMKNLYKELCGN